MTSSLSTSIFGRVDAMDAAGFAAFFNDEGRCVFGNSDPLVGPEQVEAGSAGFLSSIAGISHSVVREWVDGDDVALHLAVTYSRHDGKDVTVPVSTMYTVGANGKIDDYHVVFDLTPVYS